MGLWPVSPQCSDHGSCGRLGHQLDRPRPQGFQTAAPNLGALVRKYWEKPAQGSLRTSLASSPNSDGVCVALAHSFEHMDDNASSKPQELGVAVEADTPAMASPTTSSNSAEDKRLPSCRNAKDGRTAHDRAGFTLIPDRRTADRMALAINDWAARQGPAVIEYLYLENARISQLPTPEGVENAIESLQVCQQELLLAGPPSRDRYRAWFLRQSPEIGWASPWTIERLCGNWGRARAAAVGEPTVPVAAIHAGRLGGYPSVEGLIGLLKRWHADAPDPERRFEYFRAWMRAQMDSGDADQLPARAVSIGTFRRHFGSWPRAVANAGLLEGMSFAAFKRLVTIPRKRSEAELRAALGNWAAWASAASKRLTVATLKEWREAVLHEHWQNGVVDGVPDQRAIAGHWGSFLDALVAAGLISTAEAQRRWLALGYRHPARVQRNSGAGDRRAVDLGAGFANNASLQHEARPPAPADAGNDGKSQRSGEPHPTAPKTKP